MLFYGLGRSCAHWRKLKDGSVVTFRWLGYGSLPLAELLLGQKESFLPPAEATSTIMPCQRSGVRPSCWGQ